MPLESGLSLTEIGSGSASASPSAPLVAKVTVKRCPSTRSAADWDVPCLESGHVLPRCGPLAQRADEPEGSGSWRERGDEHHFLTWKPGGKNRAYNPDR